MAKEAPTATVTVDDAAGSGRAISNDVTNFSISTPRGIQIVTGVNSPSAERLLLNADGDITLNGVPNTAADLSHDVFKDIGSTNVARTMVIVTSSQTMTMEAYIESYEWVRNQDASITWSVSGKQSSTTVPTWS